jgi:transketolase
MTTKELQLKANEIRQAIIKMLVEAGSGHSAGPLGTADIFTALYFEILNLKPHQPNWEERDRLVLSCGHICPVLYAAMAYRGYFPQEELMTLRKFGTRLHGHPHNLALPGLETSSGPLGQGLSQAAGMAKAALMDQKKWRVYAILSDGEHDEGQTWEAVLFAGKNKLHNLTAIIDRNNIQIDGFTEDVMPLDPVADKYRAFGWHVLEIDGHNFNEIIAACRHARAVFEKPTVIIAYTIPGKGVDFMENDWHWHGKPPKPEEARVALRELRTLGGKIRSEHE